jgi:L-lactate dehydrogenase complex protein LldG
MVEESREEGPAMTETDSRRDILERVRSALRVEPSASRAEERMGEWRNLPREYRQRGTWGEAERIALFNDRVRHYHGTVHQSHGDVRSDIARILSARGKRVLIVPSGLPANWLPNGFMFIADESLSKGQLNKNDGVITACTLAIALTGTIVLESSPEQGRRAATLIPDYHLCVLRKEDIVEFVPEAIRKLEGVKHRPLTFFSGPSATVDIEMTRVRGVHGPRTLDILIV